MATQEEVFEQVKGILSQQLGVDEVEVTIESSFQADLDADSLDLVELIMELEDQFGVKISGEVGWWFFAKASGEAAINVTLRWRNP